MRKFAGKCVALLMALLMLLTSMPLTALADSVVSSVPFTIDALEDTGENASNTPALDAVNAAIAENSTSGEYVSIFKATPPAQAVKTGESFNYTIGVKLGPAVTYYDSTTNESVATYSQYKNIKVTFTAPEHIVFANGTNSYTHEISPVDISSGGVNREFEISARMTNNGEAKDGFDYGAITATITADVDVDDGNGGTVTKTFTYTLGQDASSNTTGNVTNTASTDWTLAKSEPVIQDDGAEADTVTITWTIKVGRTTDAGLSGDGDYYDVTGTLNFDAFVLTDTLPEINGSNPLSWTLAATGTQDTWSGKTNAVSTNYYDTIALTDSAANASGVKTPYYTEYTLTAVYPRSAFVLDYGETANIPFTNTASLSYTPVEGSADSKSAEADGAYGIPTNGGTLTITEQLRIGYNSNPVNYNEFYASVFTGGASFAVYKAEDWENNAPKATDANGQPVVPVATTSVTNSATATVTLAPGDYYVMQTGRPEDTNAAENSASWPRIHIESNGSATATFVNPVPGMGIVQLTKYGETTSTKLAGVEFTLDDGNNHKYTFTTNSDGGWVQAVYVGENGTTYTLTETSAPDNYYKADPIEVTVKTDGTTTYVEVFNIQEKTGSLTVNKRLNDANTAFTDTSASFTFHVYQGKKDAEGNIVYNNTAYETITLPNGSRFTSTITGIPAADENGVPYYYKVEEADPAADTPAAYYTKVTTEPIEFDFWDEENDKPSTTLTATANFVNKLSYSDLKIKKVEQGLTGGQTAMQGIVFEVYEGVPAQDKSNLKATITTGTDGVATESKLPVYDATGAKIQYYIVETNVSGEYTVDYPGNSNDYWGPIELSATSRTTNLTNTPVVNRKNDTAITIKKVDSANQSVAGAVFTVTFPDKTTANFTTGTDGTVQVTKPDGTELDRGEYTVTETSVPASYLDSGAVTVTGASATTGGGDGTAKLKATFTLDALDSATVNFKNDNKPTLTVTKKVGNATQENGTFTFELYTKEGNTYTKVTADGLGNSLDTFTNGDTLTLNPGTYYIKEVGFPAGVVAPAADAYTPVTLNANQTGSVTIDNDSSFATLTLRKQDSKSGTYLTGAVVEIAVTNTNLTDEDKALLVDAGFKDASNAFSATQSVTISNANGLSVSLPAFLADGKTPVAYTVKETAAPENYILDESLAAVAISLVANAPLRMRSIPLSTRRRRR